MKRLMLLRHGKSLRNEAMKDKDRPLNDRGRRDAPRMGGYMHHKGYVPDLVLCSSARRTVETWQAIAPEFDSPVETRFTDALYLATARNIVKVLEGADRSATLLAIGHNPGMEECARMLAREPATLEEREHLAALSAKYPTCALAVFEFDIESWREVTPGRGTLLDFAKPKGLKDD
jgi:phosphohistidine phosphatase